MSAEIKNRWKESYKSVPETLDKMADIGHVLTAFNANIDAVIKISGKQIAALAKKLGLSARQLEQDGPSLITTPTDALRGLLHCFAGGIAEEWLVSSKDTYEWLHENIGYDRLQMGGQGGIVANAMAVCGTQNVYAHCASLPAMQAKLFLDMDNLQSVDENGALVKAHDIDRTNDAAMIHWIIEFDGGDKVTIDGLTFTCPKSNRFIATFDPLNFVLHIDDAFAEKTKPVKHDYIILSGYHMLQKTLFNGTSGTRRIDESLKTVHAWKEGNPGNVLHLEVASTQDITIRKHILDGIAKHVDSMGLNEQETIDLIEIMDLPELVMACEKNTSADNLFDAMLRIFEYTGCPRVQLHMFGLYITLQKKDFTITPQANKNGMQLAATIAAGKAGTGSIDTKDALLWAQGREVSDVGLAELKKLADYVTTVYGANNLLETGLYAGDTFDIIAVPTILVHKPVTLVGMGDTISSISLVGAQA